jgi:predicted nucleic acid-binding protein
VKLLDASTLINLVNGMVFELLIGAADCQFVVGPVVRTECGSAREQIEAAVARGNLEILDGAAISVTAFLEALAVHELGRGETECLVAAEALGATVCCDDNAARTVMIAGLGRERVVGTIGLLRKAVSLGILEPKAAESAYGLMRSMGGFLPRLDDGAFG